MQRAARACRRVRRRRQSRPAAVAQCRNASRPAPCAVRSRRVRARRSTSACRPASARGTMRATDPRASRRRSPISTSTVVKAWDANWTALDNPLVIDARRRGRRGSRRATAVRRAPAGKRRPPLARSRRARRCATARSRRCRPASTTTRKSRTSSIAPRSMPGAALALMARQRPTVTARFDHQRQRAGAGRAWSKTGTSAPSQRPVQRCRAPRRHRSRARPACRTCCAGATTFAELCKIGVAGRQQGAKHEIDIRIGKTAPRPTSCASRGPLTSMPIQKSNGFAGSSQSGRIVAHGGQRLRAQRSRVRGRSRPADRSRSRPSAPLVVAMPTRLPRGLRQHRRARASALRKSSSSSARAMPYCRNAPSRMSLSEASEPVCEAEALAPSWVRPGLSTTIGLVLRTSRALSRNARGLRMLSI